MKSLFFALALNLSISAFAGVEGLEVKSLSDGKTQPLESLVGGKKLLVIIEQGNQCPVFKRYVPFINELVLQNKDKSVTFVLINSFRKADAEAVKKELDSLKLSAPVYLDVEQKIAKHFGLSTLSEAALIEVATMKLLYRGAIDDRVTYYYAKNDTQKPYLNNAISNALAGKEISPNRTQTFGCAISFD